ncbi:MAG: heparinase II/III family protein [Clostridia bacterium]|nr:heparinase II/III family protein [Clostridia bacterium]
MLEKFKDEAFLKEYRESEKYKLLREQFEKMYAERTFDEPLMLKFSKFRMFAEKGERNLYEFALNQHIDTLHMNAYKALFWGGEYISRLEDALYDVLSIYVWAIHAHVPDINEENYYELDLCSTALASAIAMIDYLMGDKLHPLIRKRINTELRRRVLEPFKAQEWHWEDRYNNWTSVCAGNTGVALMLKFPEEFDALLPRFNENMRKFIAGFSDDGVCYEGAGYWGYGLCNFMLYAMLVKDYTNGEIDYFKDPKVKDICRFFEKVTLSSDIITCYGDTTIDIKLPTSLLFPLKSVYGDEIWVPKESRLALPSHFAHMLMYIEHYDPKFTSDELKNAEYYMPDAGWYTRRTDKYAIAARGGWNGDSHNHNDVGSFMLVRDNRQVLIDMGTRYYTKDYFQMPNRYNYLETSSRGHNVPVINGQYQANVCDTRSYTSFENGIFSVDFRELYDIKELKKLIRHYRAEDDSVTIYDEYDIEGNGSFTERLVSYLEPKISEGRIEIDNVVISFDATKGKARYETDIHMTKNPDDTTNETLIYLTSIDVVSSESSFEFKIDMI